MLELAIAAADLPRLLRGPALAPHRAGRCKIQRIATVWHDTAAGDLQGRDLAIAEQGGRWRLERLVPNGVADWPPATPAPVLAEGVRPEDLGQSLSSRLVPVAAFTGLRRSYRLRFGAAEGRLEVLEGALRGVAHEQPACRLLLCGPPDDLPALAMSLAAEAPLTVPRAGLGADAVAVARGSRPAPRHLGAPDLPPRATVSESLRLITGHLADVILYWAPLTPSGATAEPVHQMRVAVRRLRAALQLFRRLAPGIELRDLGEELKDLAAALGAARDWDVFIAGSGAAVQAAFPGDERIAGLLAAAGRKRTAAYAALGQLFAGEAWRLLSLRLALLPTAQPWRDPADAAQAAALAEPARPRAAHALERLHKQLLRAGDKLDTLPASELHTVRKQGKKLRYAIEFCAPLFSTRKVRRLLERLEALQEALGTVNDGHVTATLMGTLKGGADRAFAAGVVQGFVAARAARATDRAAKSWTKYKSEETFWN